SDPNGDIQSYQWDFGDGASTDELSSPTRSHTYATQGSYTVTLTVTDSTGKTDQVSKQVDVADKPEAPTASFTFSPSSPTTGESVTFDASGSSDPNGDIQSYQWDFGDGASTDELSSPTRSHAYGTQGTYTVTLTVTDSTGNTDQVSKQVAVGETEQPPSASFTFSPSSPTTGEAVTFDASGSSDPNGDIQSYQWDFGDGASTGELSSPTRSHTYGTQGTYTVTLTVTDSTGATDSASKQVAVGVAEQEPSASFTFSPSSPTAGDSVTFDASETTDADGTIQSYQWDFGDGASTDELSSPTTTHAYASQGTYSVTLTVVDDAGLSDSVTKSVSVESDDDNSGDGDDGSDGDDGDDGSDDGDGDDAGYDGFEDGDITSDPEWTVEGTGGIHTVNYDAHTGERGLELAVDGGDSHNTYRLNHPFEGGVPEGTVFSTWAKTNSVGPADHRVYQVGTGSGTSGNFAHIRFRKGAVQINGDAMGAQNLWSNPSADTWYKFEMEILGDGKVDFRVRDEAGDVIRSNTLRASASSDYEEVQLWTRDVSDRYPTATFDEVRYTVPEQSGDDPRQGTNTTVDVVLEGAPAGLQQYNLTVESTAGATIQSVEPDLVDGREFVVFDDPGDARTTFGGADIGDTVGNFEDSRTLATLTVEGEVAASDLSVTVHRLTDDTGASMDAGRVSVRVDGANPFDAPIGNGANPPADHDGDGLYEDVDGDGSATFDDAISLAFVDTSSFTTEQTEALDFDGDGDVDFDDAISLAFSV
ncbi:MAG: PKD domain-containing protein, partial [Halobacteriota archaeon]